MSKKPNYAAIPMRAMGDKRVTSEGFRVLMAIAAHDRLTANAIGCYAAHERLAELAACEYHSLSRTVGQLVQHGYLERVKSPFKGNTRVYRVVYNDFDAKWFSQGKVSTAANRELSKSANEKGDIVSKPKCEAFDSNNEFTANILGETFNTKSLNTSREATALNGKASGGVSAMLSLIERSLKSGVSIAYDWQGYAKEIADNPDQPKDVRQWAQRLLEQWETAA